METNGLSFENKNSRTYCNIILEADSCDIYHTIDTLLECLAGMDESLIRNPERFHIVQLIRAMMPSKEQMQLLSDSQLKPSKTQ